MKWQFKFIKYKQTLLSRSSMSPTFTLLKFCLRDVALASSLPHWNNSHGWVILFFPFSGLMLNSQKSFLTFLYKVDLWITITEPWLFFLDYYGGCCFLIFKHILLLIISNFLLKFKLHEKRNHIFLVDHHVPSTHCSDWHVVGSNKCVEWMNE